MSTTETITWYATSERMPDADATVLIEAPGCNDPVGAGWWDGAEWRSADGWPLHETPVVYWAEMPRGPR